MRRLLCCVLLLSAFSAAFGAAAGEVPPALMVRVGERSEPLPVTELRVEGRVFGFLAETRMTLTFQNPHERVLEGELYFPLPEGATVSGYALDINGQMVDGVVVEKDRGRQVFEKIVRRGIDPGLVEWTRGNNFKTRVYPIPAGGTRTVMVRYVSELEFEGKDAVYALPLRFRSAIRDVSLRIEVLRPVREPVFAYGQIEGMRFVRWEQGYLAEKRLKDAAPGAPLAVRLPGARAPQVLVERDPEGKHHFCVLDFPLDRAGDAPEARAKAPAAVTILWDASGSRAGADHARETAFLKAYFGAAPFKGRRVGADLVLFRNEAAAPERFTIRDGDASRLLDALARVRYDGGTQMGCLPAGAGPAAPDLYLLFTDGISNFGRAEPGRFQAPVCALSASAGADAPLLRRLAGESGGQYFNLLRTDPAKAAALVGLEPLAFQGIAVEAGRVEEACPRGGEPVSGRFALASRLLTDEAAVTVRYGGGARSLRSTRFVAKREDAVEGDLLRRYWAQKKLAELLLYPKRNREAVAGLGKAHGIVTPETSLIVLDNAAQYIEHRIRPPASMPGWRRAYDEAMAKLDRQAEEAEKGKLAHILELWNARVQWWESEFKYPPDFKYKQETPAARGAVPTALGGGGGESAGPAGITLPGGTEVRRRTTPSTVTVAGDTPDPVIEEQPAGPAGITLPGGVTPVTVSEPEEARRVPDFPGPRFALAAGKGPPTRPAGAAIAIQPGDPKAPYLAGLKEAGAGGAFSAYMKERAKYGTSPAFYLDCADFLLGKGERALGLRVLSNIAEMELENAALLRVLGHRLAQLGELDLAVLTFEEVKRLRPEEPQSWRDLALVLARRAERTAFRAGLLAADAETVRKAMEPARADYARALELLAHVVMNRWDRFDEIELIALMEINALWPRARAAGVERLPLDGRLARLLDADVRILLTWDTDLTDIDLWVIEPSGEKAYYGHTRTTIGGNFSRDFTQGYGPEEYVLRKAMRGKYQIQAQFYGSGAQKLTGAVTLQAEVFTNFGRPGEKRQAITLRLKEEKEVVEIGEVSF